MWIDEISRRLDQIIVKNAKQHPENDLMRELAQRVESGHEGDAESRET